MKLSYCRPVVLLSLLSVVMMLTSCGQNTTAQSPINEAREISESKYPTIVTRSTSAKLSAETVEQIKNAKAILHRFSDGRVLRVFNDSGDAVDFGNHIIVANFKDLPIVIEEYEKRIANKKVALLQNPLIVSDAPADSSKISTQGVGIKPHVCVPSFLDGVCLWQSGIPYFIDSSVTGANVTKVTNAINAWNASNTGVKYRPRTNTSEPWVNFRISDSCSSWVGRYQATSSGSYFGQNINLDNAAYCIDKQRAILHEMGHATGLWHEQQRCDRDAFLVVTNTDDVNYGKRCESNVAQYGKLDFDSVMMYSQLFVTPRSDLPEFPSTTYDGNSANMGLLNNLSLGDESAINQAYQLPNPATTSIAEAHGANYGWQSWVNNNTVAGTTGQGLRLEAFRITVKNIRAGLGISYQPYVSGLGWLQAVSDGGVAGTTGTGRQLEAFQISLTGSTSGCSLSYRAHAAGIGWMSWVGSGVSGTTGQNRRLEAIQVNISCN